MFPDEERGRERVMVREQVLELVPAQAQAQVQVQAQVQLPEQVRGSKAGEVLCST